MMLHEKISEVKQWLQTIYKDERRIPFFEVNEFTIETLYRMKQASEETSKNVSVVINDSERKIEEFKAETARLKAINEHVGISPLGLMTSLGRSALRNLASAACSLELGKPSEADYLLALNDVIRKRYGVRHERTLERRVTESLARVTVQMLLKVDQIQKLLPEMGEEREAEEAQCQKLKMDIEFLNAKKSNYRSDILKLEEKYKQRGMDQLDGRELTHQAIRARLESLQMLKHELALLHNKLNGYKDLPPSVELACLKIAETKCELEEMEKNIMEQISTGQLSS